MRVPSSKTRAGVPLTLCLRPSATLRCIGVSHAAMLRAGAVPSSIQSRQARVLSLAHQMFFDFSGESPPRMGIRKV